MTRQHSSVRNRRRLAVWALLSLVVAVLALGAVVTPAVGHAYLSESDPANGETLEAVPEEVTLTFSGDGVQVVTDATVTNPDGEVVSGEAEIDEADSQIVRIPLESAGGDGAVEDADEGADADGVYTVHWEVLGDDGHTTAGSFFFSVGDESLDRDAVLEAYADEDQDDETSMGEAGAKGVLLLALVGLVGIPVTAWIAVYPVLGRFDVATRDVDRRLTRLLAGAGVVFLVSVVALGLLRTASLGGLSSAYLSQFVETPLGRVWLVQLTVAGALAALLVAGASGAVSRRGWLAGSILGGLALTVTVSWSSHSATAIDRLQGTVVDFAHVAGAGLWVGGLFVLAVVVPGVLTRIDAIDRKRVAASVIRRYSIVSLTGVTLALTTGLVLAAWHAPTLEHFTETVYGTALSAKTVLVFLALGLGGLTRYVLLRRLESGAESGRSSTSESASGTGMHSRSVREDGGQSGNPSANADTDGTTTTVTRAIHLEVTILVGVLLLSGFLTSTPTAVMAGDDHGPELGALEREFDEGVLTLSALPAHQDRELLLVDEGSPVVFEVEFASESGGEPIASDRTVAILAHNERTDTTVQFDLEETDDGTYATVQALPDDQWWEVRVSGEPDGTYVSEWFDVYAIPADHDHGDHDHGPEETGFTTGLRLGAMAVGVIGSLAVSLETIRFGRRQSRE